MFNTKHLCSRSFLVAAAGLQSLWSLSLAIVYIYTLLVMQSLQNNQIVTLFAIGDKVMKNQEAVDIVKPIKDPQAAAKRLTTEALARKSKDDISCIAIRFG